jgi:hypothetical protein
MPKIVRNGRIEERKREERESRETELLVTLVVLPSSFFF